MPCIRVDFDVELIPFCPEQLGGLPTPRYPSEIKGSQVINDHGQDVTDSFEKGAREALKLCRIYHAKYAVLKEKSPSCGNGQVYDGSFSGRLVEGRGVTADLLIREGIEVFGESELDRLLVALEENN